VSNQSHSPLAQRRILARRLIVGGLVVLCLIVLSIYGRESSSGPLHGLQSGAGTLVTPIQDGVSRAVQPVRNAWHWAKSLVNARDRAAQLAMDNQQLKAQIVQGQFNSEENQRLTQIPGLGNAWNVDYNQVPADIISWSASPYYDEARIDKGTSNGVIVNSPVIAAGTAGPALVGVITQAGPISSTVAFLSQPQTSVGVTITNANSAFGILQPTAPGAYEITGIPVGKPLANGDIVDTAGFRLFGQLSIFPRGIPIGLVEGVGHRETDVNQTVQVDPFVDPNSLAYVVALAPKSALAKQRATTP
jgi:rod shape-determining protein MreC